MIRDPESHLLLSSINKLVREKATRQLSLLPCTSDLRSKVVPMLRSVILEKVADAPPHTAVMDPRPRMTAVTAQIAKAETFARPYSVWPCERVALRTIGGSAHQTVSSYHHLAAETSPATQIKLRLLPQFNDIS